MKEHEPRARLQVIDEAEGGALYVAVSTGSSAIAVPGDVSVTEMMQNDVCDPEDATIVEGVQLTLVAVLRRQLGGLVAPFAQELLLHDG